MHNESQISRHGEWGDASVVEDNKGRLNYYCRYCEYKTIILEKIKNHIPICKEKSSKLIEGIDYVHCKLCNFYCQKLNGHIQLFHKNISIEEYKAKFGDKLICDNSRYKYTVANTNKENWITIAKRNGDDLSEYFKKLSSTVSSSIMNDPEERKRRSELMKDLNKNKLKTPEIKKMLSESAKKTSARPDIQAKRAEVLRKWREENPEEFKNKCVDKMLAAPRKVRWFSKPEKELFNFLKNLDGFNFKFNHLLKSKIFDWKSKIKQVDIVDKIKKIFIEFDGPWHFAPINSEEKFATTKHRDGLLDQYIIENNYLLIRISYDQYTKKFKQECLDEIVKILKNNNHGIYKIGKKYG